MKNTATGFTGLRIQPLLALPIFLWLMTEIAPAFGHGDTIESATPISIGSSISGSIDWGGDLDYFSVALNSSGTLTVYTSGSTDTYGHLLESTGGTVATNDDGGSGYNFQISASLTAGTYYILVHHYSTSGTGDYTLYTDFTPGTGQDDHGDTTSSATTVGANDSISGTIDYNGDLDYFRVQLGSSGTLIASTSGNTDTYGYLLDSGGSVLVYNDDNPYPNFGFTKSVGPGTYYVKVRHYSSGTGSYTLSLSFSGSGGGGGGGPVTLGEALDNTSLSWSTYGNGSWYGQTGTYQSGGDSAQSSSIDHNEYATVETTVNGPGTLSFYWRVSSESCCDKVRFYIDGLQQTQLAGEIGWTFQSYDLASGSHSVRWTYSTDWSIFRGSNTAWIDNVQFSESGSITPASNSPSSVSPELVWRHMSNGLNAVWFMDGINLDESEPILPDIVADLDWEIVGTGDFNSDGQSDLVWQHRTLGFIGIWFMDGRAMAGTALTEPSQASDLGWRIVGVADFNLDGHPDLLWHHDSSSQIAIWHMDGTQLVDATLTSLSTPNPPDWDLMGTGDFNRDSYPDLLWQHPSWGYVAVWYMIDASFISSVYTSPTTVSDIYWKAAGTGDFNQDGNIDIAWQHDSNSSIAAWYMNNNVLSYSTPFNPTIPDHTDWKLQAIGDIQPTAIDTDGDLMPDSWETLYFGDLSHPGYEDFDEDGVNNLQEYRSENDPTEVNLVVKISRPRNGTNIP